MTAGRLSKYRKYFARNALAMDQLEVFLVSAVSIILIIRISLELAGYPQLGGDSLHIAHMLWGGLGMLVAALMRQMLLGRWVEYAGAFVGGMGFGAFIDEIGKFVTKDNNYFFTPTFSLIYVIFVLIYLTSRWLLTFRGYSRAEYLMNSVNALQQYRGGHLSDDHKNEIQNYLSKSDPDDMLTKAITGFVKDVETVPSGRPTVYERLKRYLRDIYYRVVKTRHFTLLLTSYFIAHGLIGTVFIFEEVFYPKGVTGELESPSFSDISLLISNGISTLLIIAGVILLRRSRLSTYRMFERAMLVNILLSQIFLFTINQLGALTGLFYNLLVYGAIRFVIRREEEQHFWDKKWWYRPVTTG